MARETLQFRDDRFFWLATEDTYAAKQYFDSFRMPRVKIVCEGTPIGMPASAQHVVERLKRKKTELTANQFIWPDDQFWIVIDTDHQIEGNHVAGYVKALDDARQHGFRIAISNPSFEVWLLLHHETIAPGTHYEGAEAVGLRLRELLGFYNKCNIDAARFSEDLLPHAVKRARALEDQPDNPKGYWPQNPGSRVYQIIQELLPGIV